MGNARTETTAIEAYKPLEGRSTKEIMKALSKGPSDVYAAQTRAAIKLPTQIAKLINTAGNLIDAIKNKPAITEYLKTNYDALVAEATAVEKEQASILKSVSNITKEIKSGDKTRASGDDIKQLTQLREKALALGVKKSKLEESFITFGKMILKDNVDYIPQAIRTQENEVLSTMRY
tara:strand:- start:498 stop:1028 length:531 start_codon:yes stop_codon:yes gene_type:complete